MNDSLFTNIQLGKLNLTNRIVLPPMTRSRASQPGNTANDLMAEYYAQRASAGLVITEGTQISPMGQGYAWTPGIYSKEQIEGWEKVTRKVHEKQGVIFAQLWHVGRISHPDTLGGKTPIAPSAIKPKNVKIFIDDGTTTPHFQEITDVPREMTTEDIANVVNEFKQAALNAMTAGFDGVELHAANGYLINQFIDSESNKRTDAYGGSITNRLRFLDEIVVAVSDAIGADKLGVRLAPFTSLNGSVDKTPEETYLAAAALLNKRNVAYIHIAEVDWEDAPETSMTFKQDLRKTFQGVLIYAGKYTAEKAVKAIDDGLADMIGFGRSFISNPDLPSRIKNNQPLALHNPDTLFGGKEKGLTDYPTYQG